MLSLAVGGLARAEGEEGRWWSEAAARSVDQAGEHGGEWRRALKDVPEVQRASWQFLLENMPERDLRSLSADFVRENVALATVAREDAPWAKDVPEEVFLNDVLPYANVSERRDPWRADLRARCLPLIEGCTTTGQAALRLNEALFGSVKVKYSTARERADQSPAESMASGQASCTGLSILLVDACRSVGVPARVVGIPDWVDGRGNHTWVEVWDAGGWHFVGAAEPDKRGLDHAWFERDAALAQRDAPRHAIYAVSYRRTGLVFPLVWKQDSEGVDAENVTERYARAAGAGAADGKTARVMVRVYAREGGPRVPAQVKMVNAADPAQASTGVSKDEGADTNDMLGFELPRGQAFELSAEFEGMRAQRRVEVGQERQQIVEVALEGGSADAADSDLRPALKDFFGASAERQAAWKFEAAQDEFLRRDPGAVRRIAQEEYRAAAQRAETEADFAESRVRSGEYVSPYTLRKVGEKPAQGWGLVIAMHGGGGAPAEVNDSQWRIMQRYYRDHPEAGGGYIYLALRAPNDTWNGFYDDYVYPLVDKLIRQVGRGEEVDPNRVYLIGYSHGGYGAFAIGPKMPDHFAAIHSSAAAPTDGQVSPKTLRNTPFDFAVGEFDDAYGRRERCEAFARAVQELRGPRVDVFPVTFSLVAGRHHSDLPDHDQLREMLPLRRQAAPRELTWEETDGVISRFYWLVDPAPVKGHEIDATCRENRLVVSASRDVGRFTVLLDERLVDFGRPLSVVVDGRDEQVVSVKPTVKALARTLAERGDVGLAFSCAVGFRRSEDGTLRATVE